MSVVCKRVWGVAFGLVGLGQRQPFSLNGIDLGCTVLALPWHGMDRVDKLHLCKVLAIVLVEWSYSCSRIGLLVCIDTCRLSCCFCFVLFFCFCFDGFLEAPDRKQMFRPKWARRNRATNAISKALAYQHVVMGFLRPSWGIDRILG